MPSPSKAHGFVMSRSPRAAPSVVPVPSTCPINCLHPLLLCPRASQPTRPPFNSTQAQALEPKAPPTEREATELAVKPVTDFAPTPDSIGYIGPEVRKFILGCARITDTPAARNLS